MQRQTIALAVGLLVITRGAWGREWTDVSGKYHTEARLLQCCDNTAWLERPNGKLLLVPLEKLSSPDRAYVAREFPNQGITIERGAAKAEPALAKSVAPARPPAELTRARARATIRFASLKRQPEELPEAAEEPAAIEPPAGEAPVEEPPVEAPGESPSDEPAAIEEPSEAPTSEPVDLPAESQEPPEVEQSQPPESTEEVPQPTSATPPEKFIYSGRCGTFHLIGEMGTGAYWYQGKHYLAMLFKAGEDANYLYYDSSHPDGQIIQWYFSKTERCCKFWVWKRTGLNEHGHYEREYRSKPN